MRTTVLEGLEERRREVLGRLHQLAFELKQHGYKVANANEDLADLNTAIAKLKD